MEFAIIVALDDIISYEAVGTQSPHETLIRQTAEISRLREAIAARLVQKPTQEHLLQIPKANL